MGKKRKTIEVKELVEFANKLLKDSKDSMKKERSGICTVIEHALHTTGNYHGFSYLPDQFEQTTYMGEPAVRFIKNHDETRRFYHFKEN